MESEFQNLFSGPVTVFHEKRLPEKATPVGYAALIDVYRLKVPFPHKLYAIGTRHTVIETAEWRILTPRYLPTPDLVGNLIFALKYEGLDLIILKRVFEIIGPKPIEALVLERPSSGYLRRIWFLYEWLINEQLDLPNATKGSYVEVVNPDLQWAIGGKNSTRHRVRNNLPGTSSYCPLVFRTEKLKQFIGMDLARRARAVIDNVPKDLLSRTAAFLLLKDSKSSYAIEGEHAPHDRIQRWGRAIGEAGKRPVDLEELLRLQRIVIGDARFVKLGLRQEGGFVGEHDRDSRMPLPDHISARHNDLPSLIDGLTAFDKGPALELDAVIASAILAFGFVYIHPFEDGNGRIHRYLMHHVLAMRGYNPPGIVFPVSSAILEKIAEYREVLESYSERLLPFIEWKPTSKGNVEVLNDTADFYRFFDATPHAEFLYSCVQKTIEEDLPNETEFLRRYDTFREFVSNIVDMPESKIDLLFHFLQGNKGILSKRARENEFAQLTESEVLQIEDAYASAFAGM